MSDIVDTLLDWISQEANDDNIKNMIVYVNLTNFRFCPIWLQDISPIRK